MGPMIPEVDEEDFEDLQLYPFDEPMDEDVLWMAQLLGIHPIKDKQLLYLAEEALINPPSQEWMIFKDIAGNVIWINDVTEEMEPHPPHIEELIENVQRQKRRLQEQEARGSSQDKSSAMKKLLGRHLPNHELISGNDEPLNGSKASNSGTPLPLGGLLGNRYAPLPAKGGPNSSQSLPNTGKQSHEPQKQVSEPPKSVGGKMNLMKALEASRQQQPEPTPQPPMKQNNATGAGANPRQTSASTAATSSKPQSGVSHTRTNAKAKHVADDSGEEFDMDEYKEDEGDEEQQEDGDSVFDKRLGGHPEQDDDDEDGDHQSTPSDEESEEDSENPAFGQKGVLLDQDDEDLDEEDEKPPAKDVKQLKASTAATQSKPTSSSQAGNRPTSAAQPQKQHGHSTAPPAKQAKGESKPKQGNSKASSKPQPTNNPSTTRSEDQNSLLLSQLLSDFQQIQQKVSRLEQDNQELKERNDRLEKTQTPYSNGAGNQSSHSGSQQPATQGLEEHNIKSGIAEIKKLLEQSILIQNNGKEGADHQRSSETKFLEENRSIVTGNTGDTLRPGMVPQGVEHTYSSPHYLMSATFPTNSQPNGNQHSQTGVRPLGMGLPQLPNYSMVLPNDWESKWSTLISRERERLQSAKLTLQNEKLTLENRKLTLKKHEFEMRKEMQGIKLEDGHPLASKIKDNIMQQKNIYKNGVSMWRERCSRHIVKQKSLNMLEKSYMFAKSSGSACEVADKHLEELYSAYCQADEETTAELKDQPEDDLLSEDSQGIGIDSESERMFDDTHSKSEKVSSTDMGLNVNRLAFEEPTKYKYNLEEIRRSVNQPYTGTGSSWFTNSNPNGTQTSMLNSREGIRSYFQQNSKFYSSMRKEVVAS